MTVTGSNFLPNPGPGSPQVTINTQSGGTMAAPLARFDATSIAFVVPTGAVSGPLTVTVAGQSVTSVDVLTILPSHTFTLTAVPSTVDVIQGQPASYVVTLDSANGFAQLATLAVAGLPTGVTASFTPPQIAAGQSAVLTVTAASTAPPATGVLLTVSASATVDVYAGTTFKLVDGTSPNPFPLTAIQVPTDRLPDAKPPNPAMLMVFIVAFQPANATASQPVAVYFPNTINTPPGGMSMALMTLDPTRGEMVQYGTGAVSNDGTQVVPDFDPAHPGKRFGLVHFDWHGQMPPPPDPATFPNPCPDPCPPQAGDPIDLSSGIAIVTATDMAINGLRGALTVTRTYRTLSTVDGPFGIGTSHNYGYRLDTLAPQTAALINLVMPDGNRFPFSRQPNGSLTNTTTPSMRGAVMTTLPDGHVDLRWKDGTTFRFAPGVFLNRPALESITDTKGNRVSLTRNPARLVQITQVTDPVGRSLTLSYDGADRITSITDPIGRTVQYTYNAPGTLATVTDPEGGVTSYDYDAQNRLTRVTDARGIVVAQNTYDVNGRVVQQVQADGGVYQFAYTLLNPIAPVSPVLTTTVTNPLGRQMTYRFNPLEFPVEVTDSTGQKREVVREPGTNQVTAYKGTAACSICSPASAGDRSFAYDASGNVLTSTDVLGNTVLYAYEPTFNNVTSVTDALGNITRFSYDGFGNLLTITDANGNATSFTYDLFGLVTAITDPLNQRTTLSYDNFGNLTAITDPLGQTTSFRYDAVSRLIEVMDPLGRRSAATYDGLDRILTAINAKGDATHFAYDAVGNLLSLTDANGNTTSFTYDTMNRLVTRRTPSGKVDTRTYDHNGNLTAFVDRRGQTATFAYDALNRLIHETYQDESSVEWLYDPRGRLLQANDTSGGIFDFTYDAAGRVMSAAGPFGTVQYSRDDLGRVIARQVVGQPPVTHSYDAAGNLLTAAASQASITFAYDQRNQPFSLARSNGVSTNYAYDALGRVLSLVHSKGPAVLNAQTYTYDPVGNRTGYTTDIAQPLITQPTSNLYDNENRLLQSGALTYAYDDNGNRIADTGPAETTTYSWDSRDRLQSLVTSSDQTTIFRYDFARNLVAKQTAGPGVNFAESLVLDTLTNVVYQSDSNGRQLAILTGRSIDAHFATVQPSGQVDFGLEDALNSTVATADQSGSVNGEFLYEPYGETTSSGNVFPLQYTGRVPVSRSLYYYRARFYDSVVGRFLSEDPIGFAGGDTNLYVYALNDPINLIDSDGLVAEWTRWPRENLQNRWRRPFALNTSPVKVAKMLIYKRI